MRKEIEPLHRHADLAAVLHPHAEAVAFDERSHRQKSAKTTTATNKKSKGFTDEERAAMKERAQELKAEARRGPRADKADEESRPRGAATYLREASPGLGF